MKKKDEQVEPDVPAQPELPFTVGQWATLTQWRCRYCPWDTLDGEAAAWEHYNQVHRPPEPEGKPAPMILLADRFGNPVTGA